MYYYGPRVGLEIGWPYVSRAVFSYSDRETHIIIKKDKYDISWIKRIKLSSGSVFIILGSVGSANIIC